MRCCLLHRCRIVKIASSSACIAASCHLGLFLAPTPPPGTRYKKVCLSTYFVINPDKTLKVEFAFSENANAPQHQANANLFQHTGDQVFMVSKVLDCSVVPDLLSFEASISVCPVLRGRSHAETEVLMRAFPERLT